MIIRDSATRVTYKKYTPTLNESLQIGVGEEIVVECIDGSGNLIIYTRVESKA